MSKNNGGPAFPEAGLSGLPNDEFIHGRSGMTLRDYFAAKAMLADLEYQGLEGREDLSHVAAMAYEIADAMLEARK